MSKKRLCPFCAEEIKEAAILCKHCGKELEKQSEPEIVKSKEVKKKNSGACLLYFLVGIVLFIFALNSGGGSSRGSSGGSSGGSSWICTEFDTPYRVVNIDGGADVYGGIEEPEPYDFKGDPNIKGHITGGAGGIEASCKKVGGPIYYRLLGVDWWGWVLAINTK